MASTVFLIASILWRERCNKCWLVCFLRSITHVFRLSDLTWKWFSRNLIANQTRGKLKPRFRRSLQSISLPFCKIDLVLNFILCRVFHLNSYIKGWVHFWKYVFTTLVLVIWQAIIWSQIMQQDYLRPLLVHPPICRIIAHTFVINLV